MFQYRTTASLYLSNSVHRACSAPVMKAALAVLFLFCALLGAQGDLLEDAQSAVGTCAFPYSGPSRLDVQRGRVLPGGLFQNMLSWGTSAPSVIAHMTSSACA